MMKRRIVLCACALILALLLGLCGCGADAASDAPVSTQSPDPSLEEILVGKWDTTGVLSESTGEALGLAVLGTEAQDTVFSATFEADEAGFTAINDETDAQSFEYAVSGDEVTLRQGDGETRVLTWDASNETLTYPVPGTDFVLVLSKQ